MADLNTLEQSLNDLDIWTKNCQNLDDNMLYQCKDELKIKFRDLIKLKRNVDNSDNDDIKNIFTELMKKLRELRNKTMIPPPKLNENNDNDKNKENVNIIESKPVCKFGQECVNNEAKHYYDFIHFNHKKSDEMIFEYQKILKQNKNNKILYIEYKDEDTNDDDMSDTISDTDKNDEDYNDCEDIKEQYRRRRKKKSKKQIDAENELTDIELEKLRKERLDKLLKKTDLYMRTLTNKIKKNNRNSELTRNDVKEFLMNTNHEDSVKQTKSLKFGILKDYQEIGLKWMIGLYEMNLNGILADEMGLGKTVQVISLLAYIFDKFNINGIHLIVVPLSTLSSWTEHFKVWLPIFNIHIHHGNAIERKNILNNIIKKKLKINVIITTYELCIRDSEMFEVIKFSYLIVDEAHRLKNSKSKLFNVLNHFSTKNRLLLTGTPLQNNLNELWSLLNFILPQVFDSAQSFDAWFCTPFSGKTGANNNSLKLTDDERLLIIERLHRCINPFLLRRLKNDVLKDKLKPKTEIILKVPMSGQQIAVYEHLKKYQGLKYFDDDRTTKMTNLLIQFRKCANHADIFKYEKYDMDNDDDDDTIEDVIKNSGKFCLLEHLIPKMLKFKHRILIFCQFIIVMDLLEQYFEYKKIKYLRIDGSTSSEERIERLDQFNNNNNDNNNDSGVDVFLLSTRACGLGLNLYTADTVILFESDWNPQQDMQAMARAHRIGQKNEVRVFRLLSDNSVELQIYERVIKKLDIEKKAIEFGNFNFSMNSKEKKQFLQNVLKQRINKNNNTYDAKLERKKLNKLFARNDNELKVFNEMDNNNKYIEVNEEIKLPHWLTEKDLKEDLPEILPPKRKRKQVNYNNDTKLMKELDQQIKELEVKKRNNKRKRKRDSNNDDISCNIPNKKMRKE